jgi:hypothetical protein
MNGLKQIVVVTQGDGWNLLGLDEQGRVWFGSPRRTARGRSLTWALMDESAEEEPVTEATAAPAPPTEGAARPWPTKPRP